MVGPTYLITDANRGIGLGLLVALIARENTTIIAAVRDIAASTKTLSSVPTGKDSKLIILKIDSTIETDPAAAVTEVTTKHGITLLDVLSLQCRWYLREL